MPKGSSTKKKGSQGAKAGRPARPSKPAPVLPPPLYPIRFKEIFKAKIWGGPALKKVLAKSGAPSACGESWEVAQRGAETSVVAEGPHKGMTLDDLMKQWPKQVLGDEHSMRFSTRFPLLVKFLCADDRLSLQVHPSDDYAQRYEIEPHGKMEAWYIVHAPKSARVIRGVLPGTTVAEFRQHLASGQIDQCLNVMEVKEGDVIFIPPGTIHSAFGGVVALEVQQNSDITYRFTDWGRKGLDGKPRPLDLEKAMGISDFYSMGVSKYKPARIPGFPYKRMLLIKCEKFVMESIVLEGKRVKEKTNPQRFLVMTCVRGQGKIHYGEKLKQATAFRKGETYLIPAHLGEYEISSAGSGEIVVSYVE